MEVLSGKAQEQLKIPFWEFLKGIPGHLGIRFLESPSYSVLIHQGNFEIRKYESMNLVQVSYKTRHHKDFEESAFMKLAQYIFGHNRSAKKIRMTAPVLEEKIPQGWKMSFVLPRRFKKMGAPFPKDQSLQFIEVPERLMASFVYSGANTELAKQAAADELYFWLDKQKKYLPVSEVFWAQYDPPHTLSFLRRNEALIELTQTPSL